ncbi:MAG: modified peptide precursor CbpA [Actinomycetota bacterium]|nr:modified peptide precursor CbpA [Actinomycetota bacterium]
MPQTELSSVERPSHAAEGVATAGPGRRSARPGPASPEQQPRVIAYRKACAPDGVGLAHYVLLASAK